MHLIQPFNYVPVILVSNINGCSGPNITAAAKVGIDERIRCITGTRNESTDSRQGSGYNVVKQPPTPFVGPMPFCECLLNLVSAMSVDIIIIHHSVVFSALLEHGFLLLEMRPVLLRPHLGPIIVTTIKNTATYPTRIPCTFP